MLHPFQRGVAVLPACRVSLNRKRESTALFQQNNVTLHRIATSDVL
jgi:hypothetical protein